MGTNTVLEFPAIEDTLFGDPKVTTLTAEAGPDVLCECACGCLDRTTKASNAQLSSAGGAVLAPIS
jgi:hypothetical protein